MVLLDFQELLNVGLEIVHEVRVDFVGLLSGYLIENHTQIPGVSSLDDLIQVVMIALVSRIVQDSDGVCLESENLGHLTEIIGIGLGWVERSVDVLLQLECKIVWVGVVLVGVSF